MPDSFENDLLIGSLATRIGLLGDKELAESIRSIDESGEDLRTLIQQNSQIDNDTWESLQSLAEKHCSLTGGSTTDSISTLYREGTQPSADVAEAIKNGMSEDVWKTLIPQGESDDGFSTIVPPDPAPGPNPVSDPDPIVVHHGTRFQKLHEHAAGGLGKVFVAIDDELNRQVALKQIQEHFANSEDARQRFMLEAEITGGLEHPGVVPVYGLGIYKDGQPYYAMRFIRGQSMRAAIKSLHQKCEHGRGRWHQSPEMVFELRKLLSRVIDVCQAIGYAHSRGVLHRDIKPENIMLGDYGETLVVDWGLAKVAGREEAKRSADGKEPQLIPASGSGSVPTQDGRIVGTPGFMSPEQAAGAVDQLDARSDVYSLGASLYSLLVGHASVSSKNDAGEPIGIEQILEMIRSGQFKAPRQAEPSIPKPLAAICERAMSVSPDDRYESAIAMADDLERWLADETVDAYEETRWEKTRRWIRQHQTLAASVAAVVMVSILGLGGFSFVLNQKNTQLGLLADSLKLKNTQLDQRGKELEQKNDELLIAEAKARDEAATASAVTEFLNDDLLAQASSLDHPDPRLEVRTVLDRAAEDLDGKFASRPLVKANLLKTIGVAYGYLGEFAKAEKALAGSVELFAQHLGPNHETTVARQSELGAVLAKSGQYDKGKATLESALEKLIALHGEDNKVVIDAQASLADLHTWVGDYESAERFINQAIAGNTKLLGADDADTLGYENSKATIWNYTFRWKKSVALGNDLLARATAVLGDKHSACVDIMTVLAQSYFFDGQYTEAKKNYDQAYALSRSLLGELHPSTLAIRHDLAQLDAYRGNPGIALVELRTIRQLSAKTYGEDHRETIINDQNIASVLVQLGRLEEARDLLVDTLARAEKSLAESPETQVLRFDLAHVYFDLEDTNKAEPILQAFASMKPDQFRPGDSTTWDARVLLGEMEFYDDRFDEAIELLKQARQGYSQSKYRGDTMAMRCAEDLLWCYVLNDQTDKAEALLDEIIASKELSDNETASAALALADALIEVDEIEAAEARVDGLKKWADSKLDPNQETLQVMLELAATLSILGRFDDAILQYERVLQEQTDLLGADNVDTLDTLANLAVTLSENNKADEAARVYKLLLEGEMKSYGEQSTQVLLTLSAIANLRIEQGKHADAIESLRQLRRIQEELGLGDDVLRQSDQLLADVYRQTSDIPNAIKHYESVVEGTTAENDDATRLLTLHQLAWCYDQNKQIDPSIDTYRRAVKGRTRVFGPTHEYTFLSLGNLAYVLASADRHGATETLKDLESRITVTETGAPGTNMAAYMLGESYRMLKQYDSAIRWYQTCVDLRTEEYGESSPSTLLAMHQLAFTLSLSGDRPAAAKAYAKVLPMRERVLGKSHEYTMLTLTNWGVVEALMENYDEAIRLLEDGVQRVVTTKGKDSAVAIKPRVMLASAHYLTGNYNRAIQLFRDTLEVTYRKVRTSNDTIERELAMLQIVLADSELHAGRIDDAFQHATEGLAHKVEPNKIDFYRAKSILGEIHAKRGDTEKAIELLEVAIGGFDQMTDYPVPTKRLRLQIDAINRMLSAVKESSDAEEIESWTAKLKDLQSQLDATAE